MAKILLVIGNGFDLKCGLKSSFSQYLDSEFYSPFLGEIKSIDDKLSKDIKSLPDYNSYSIYDEYQITYSNLLFWDLYFGLPHYYKDPNINEWYSFEDKLKGFVNSISDNTTEYKSISEITLRKPKPELFKDNEYKRKLILYLYLSDLSSSKKCSVNDALFEQLKLYEKRFGEYIRIIQNKEVNYISNANAIIERMCNKNNDDVVYINSFNYSDLTSLNKDIWHVNGNVDNPIFGIDYSNSNPGIFEKYRYTKTYRRLELYGNELYYPKKKEYTKILVYGHSLNEQDYSYFYALFNKLNFGTNRSDSRKGYYIEFVYSKYNGKSSDEAREELIYRVLKLFYGYNKEVLHEQNYRLIDILYSSGAIRFREIS